MQYFNCLLIFFLWLGPPAISRSLSATFSWKVACGCCSLCCPTHPLSSATAVMSSQSGTGKSQKSSTIFCQRQLNHRRGDNTDPSPAILTRDLNGGVDHLATPASPPMSRPDISQLPSDLTYDISGLQHSEWVDLAALASCAVSTLGKEECVGISELGSSLPFLHSIPFYLLQCTAQNNG